MLAHYRMFHVWIDRPYQGNYDRPIDAKSSKDAIQQIKKEFQKSYGPHYRVFPIVQEFSKEEYEEYFA